MNTKRYTPPADIFEEDKGYSIYIDMPGVGEDKVEIELDRNVLTVTGDRCVDEDVKKAEGEGGWSEYRNYSYQRAFTLGSGIDRDKVKATMKNGVLHLHLPKSQEVQPKRIAISKG